MGRSRYKQIFFNYIDSTDGHAIRNIFTTEYTGLKILWAISWLVGVAITIYLLTSSVLDFFDYNVVSQSRNIQERPMTFPKITVCNMDPFVSTESVKFLSNVIKSNAEYMPILESLGPKTDLELVNFFTIKTGSFESVALFEAQKANRSTKQTLGYSVNEFIPSCIFDDSVCPESSFEYHWNDRLGSCFTFNSNRTKPLIVKGAGKLRGLQLELFLGKNDNYDTFSDSQGAKVFVYNHSTLYSESEGIDVSAGFETNIAMHKRITETLMYPYSNCVIKAGQSVQSPLTSNHEYLHLFNRLGLKYRSMDCMNFCLIDKLIDECGCLDYYRNFFNLKNITIPKFCDWYSDASSDSICYERNILRLDDACEEMCPFECDSVTTSFSTSFSEYPVGSALKILLSKSKFLKQLNEKGGKVATKVLKVNIFYDNLSYEWLNEAPAINVITLLGGLGGTLGLFLGFSVLSTCEIVELVVNLVMEMVRPGSKKVTPKSQPAIIAQDSFDTVVID